MCIYANIYIYIYIYTHIHIYREREREREVIHILNILSLCLTSTREYPCDHRRHGQCRRRADATRNSGVA